MLNSTTGWAVGNDGLIRSTTNGGTTWTFQTSGTTQSLSGVWAFDANTLWAVGIAGTILKTTNGGTTWTAQTSGTAQTLNGIRLVSGAGYVVGGTGTILYASPAALPVTLRYFSGRMTIAGALLGWATASEQNNAYFAIERSRDARSFEAIGRVASQDLDGNSGMSLTYNFTDPQPLQGVNYYRLTQVDHDGNRTPSKVIALSMEGGTETVLYPNPVGTSGDAVLEPALAYTRYELTDMLGRVHQQVSEPGTLNSLSVGTLLAGVYVLRVQISAGQHVFRVVR